jgi:hypothetical protein
MHLIENLSYGGDIVPHVYDVMIISFIIQISILLVIYIFILKLSENSCPYCIIHSKFPFCISLKIRILDHRLDFKLPKWHK